MTINVRQYAQIFDQLLEEVREKDTEKAIAVFVNLLKKNNDLRLGDEIIKEFENYQKEKEGIKKIKVSAAKPLTEEIKKELEKFGELEEKKDPSLIGGVKLRMGDMLVDGSIKNALGNLRDKLSA